MPMLAALALMIAAPVETGHLSARPGAVTVAAKRGAVIALDRGVELYLPVSVEATRTFPLLVVMPGTNGKSRTMVDMLRPAAEAEGFALLGITPGVTANFDTIDRFFDDRERGFRSANRDWPEPIFGKDARRLDAALAAAFRRAPIGRVGLLGLSHGASYALSIGLANPTLFPTIAALSPGVLLIPAGASGRQKIFLAHGRRDEVQPYRRTACAMAPKLKALGDDVRFMERPGGHGMDEAELHAALLHFLSGGKVGPTAPPPGC